MTHKINWITIAKKNAAKEAIKHVKDGFIVGIGSGSTVAFAIEALGEKIKKEKLSIIGVPTSYQSFLLAVKHGIKISTIDENPNLDVTIDGADQIDAQLNLIKGMGGALVREKIVALESKNNIIIADETKGDIVFNLRDTGGGIPEDIRDKLFDSFVTSGKKGGTGLGLAIVKKVIDALLTKEKIQELARR